MTEDSAGTRQDHDVDQPLAAPEPPLPTTALPAYAELAKIVLGGQPLGAVLTRVSELTAELVPTAEDVSVTLIERGRPRSVAFSGRLAVVLDERQYEAGFGPCMDAAVSGEVIAIPDTSHDEAYPDFARQAARAGIQHTLSIPLPLTVQGTTGALNIYAVGEPFGAETRDLAVGFASYAAVAVANAAVYAGALDEAQQLRDAMHSRAVIEQAKGIIMAQLHCDANEAFTILRDNSNRANRKLRDIAQAVVDSISR
jgi:GAF domain-containing protein